jgi:hypothetical protein
MADAPDSILAPADPATPPEPAGEHCPIAAETVDENAARIGAGLVIAIVVAGLWLDESRVPMLLALDFALRRRGWNVASPVAQVSGGLRTILGMQPRPVNAGPKQFAALIGALFCLAIGLAMTFHLRGLALALGGVLVACAALEAFLGFCVGCKAYLLLRLNR